MTIEKDKSPAKIIFDLNLNESPTFASDIELQRSHFFRHEYLGDKHMPLLNVVVDISHHNTVTSFQEAKDSGILGVIHKATEGIQFVDANYDGRRVLATSVGLFWGAYHFGVRGNPKGQADHFLSVVNPGSTDLLVLDFEPNPREGTMTLGEAETFVTRVQEQTGRFPVLYSGQAFLREKLGNRTDTILVDRSVFIAATRASARFRNLQIMAIHGRKRWPTATSSTRHWALR